MHRHFISIGPDEPVKNAVELIFNFKFGGLPVIKKKKLVGIITEEDILQKLFPSIKEYIEDPVHGRNFEDMEHNLINLLSKPVKEIMSTNPRSISMNSPLMKAQSLMLLNNFSRLPVIDASGNVLGIISQGDIFRAIVGSEISFDSTQKFRDWLSYQYDLVSVWEERLGGEIPSLISLFKKFDVVSIADIMTGTGEHPLQLATYGLHTIGIDDSKKMVAKSKSKLKKASEIIKDRVSFIYSDYKDYFDKVEEEFDAVILMGNSAPYLGSSWPQVIKSASKKMAKNSVLVLQIRNLEFFFKQKQNLEKFTLAQSLYSSKGKYAFIVFYTQSPESKKELMATMSVLQFDGRSWSQVGVNSHAIADIRRDNLKQVLKSSGFKDIKYYGSNIGATLFKEEFNPDKHYWLNVVATR